MDEAALKSIANIICRSQEYPHFLIEFGGSNKLWVRWKLMRMHRDLHQTIQGTIHNHKLNNKWSCVCSSTVSPVRGKGSKNYVQLQNIHRQK